MAANYKTIEMPTIELPVFKATGNARSWWVALAYGFAGAVVSIGLHLWVLVALAPKGSPSLADRFMSWDADRYRQIAQFGYPHALSYDPKTHVLQGDNLAFSPLYPVLTRWVHAVVGSWTGAAITVSWISLVVCLALVYRLAVDVYGPAAGLPAVLLVGVVQPMALIASIGYPDSGLYLSFGLAAMLCVRSKSWVLAGLFASLAGLTRPTGVAVTAAVCVMAVAAWRGMDHDTRQRAGAGCVLACVGSPAYLLWVGVHVHRMNAWFAVQQAGWGTHWDNGVSFWQFLTGIVLHANGDNPLVDVMTALTVIAYALFTLYCGRRSELGLMMVWPLTVLVLTVGQSNYSFVKPRLLLAAALCLLPLAKRLAEAAPSTRWTLLVCGSLLSAWWGAYMMDIWHYAF